MELPACLFCPLLHDLKPVVPGNVAGAVADLAAAAVVGNPQRDLTVAVLRRQADERGLRVARRVGERFPCDTQQMLLGRGRARPGGAANADLEARGTVLECALSEVAECAGEVLPLEIAGSKVPDGFAGLTNGSGFRCRTRIRPPLASRDNPMASKST
jgi:hypothetical protein